MGRSTTYTASPEEKGRKMGCPMQPGVMMQRCCRASVCIPARYAAR